MLHFRFTFETDKHGNSVLESINGDTVGAGQYWSMTVGGVSQSLPINKYIPPNGVTVVFKMALSSADADEGKLLKILMRVMKLVDRSVTFSDDFKSRGTLDYGVRKPPTK